MEAILKIESTPNVSLKNNVYNFSMPDAIPLTATNTVGAMQLSGVQRDPAQVIATALRLLIGAARLHEPAFEVTLLCGQVDWSPDNRIVRYKKLWRRLKDHRIELPDDVIVSEYFFENDGKIRFYGTVKVSSANVEIIALLILSGAVISNLVLLPVASKTDLKPGHAWDTCADNFDFNVLCDVLRFKGLLFWKALYEGGDEHGFTGLGETETLNNFVATIENASKNDGPDL